MEYVHNLIWLCPMLFVAGFIDSIAGGGGLIAMPAYMMCGMPMYYVYGCNKFQCAFGSTAAAYLPMRIRGCSSGICSELLPFCFSERFLRKSHTPDPPLGSACADISFLSLLECFQIFIDLL